MDTLSIAQELIRCDSVSHATNTKSANQLQQMLQHRGFEVQSLAYHDLYGVEKLAISAVRYGKKSTERGLAFLTHNDVVSVDGWHTEHAVGPFEAAVVDGRLWGRGACDMKGPIASALSAIDALPPSRQTAPIYFFVTGDEECGMVGAQLLTQQCPIFQQMVAAESMGIITEPTQLRVVNAHKGGCQFTVSAHGISAHSSTKDGLNANWQLIPWMASIRELAATLDTDPSLKNKEFDPPTLSLNIVVKNTPAAYNITVGLASCTVFLRTMPQTAWQQFVERLIQSARDLELDIGAISSLPPVHTSPNSPLVKTALRIAGQTAPVAMSYATDGCRYTDLKQMIVLGPGSVVQAHRCDEWIDLEQLDRGSNLYLQLLECYVGPMCPAVSCDN